MDAVLAEAEARLKKQAVIVSRVILDGVEERERAEHKAAAAGAPPAPAVRRAKMYAQKEATRREEVESVIREELLRDPQSDIARAYLHDKYGVALGATLPAAQGGEAGTFAATKRPLPGGPARGRIFPAKTTAPLSATLRASDDDDNAPTPNAAECFLDESLLATGKGVYDLITRGAMRHTVDLSATLSGHVSTAQAQLHRPPNRFQRGAAASSGKQTGASMNAATLATLHLDKRALAEHARKDRDASVRVPAAPASESTTAGGDARGFETLQDAYSLHQFMIRKGVAIEGTPEFSSFKRAHASQWQPIARLIRRLEDACKEAKVGVILVDGKALAALVDAPGAVDVSPDDAALVACIANESGRELLQSTLGINAGPTTADPEMEASTREAKMQQMERNNAARVVQREWRLYALRLNLLRRATQRRLARRATFARLQNEFFERWDDLRSSRRVVVHIPSAAGRCGASGTDTEALTRQGGFMSRLCCVSDPDVECVLATPARISEDVLSYYVRLLEAGGCDNVRARVCVVNPENARRLPPGLSLAKQLLCSPAALKRIRTFCRGREAYMVPLESGADEMELCVDLGVPLLGTDPALAQTFRLQSAARDIFKASQMPVAPGLMGVRSEGELYVGLAELMIEHPRTQRWLVKLEDDTRGSGHMFVDAHAIKPVAGILAVVSSSARTYASGQSERTDALEGLAAALHRHMPRCATIVRPHGHARAARRAAAARARAHSSHSRCGGGGGGDDMSGLEEVSEGGEGVGMAEANGRWLPLAYVGYMTSVERVGCVVEAAPNEVLGSPSVSLMVEPTGDVRVLSACEQLFCPPYVCVGASFPQSSVPHKALAAAAEAVGVTCHSVGAIGYIGVDFVVSCEGGVLKLWPMELHLRQTDSQAIYELFDFVAAGEYDPEAGAYRVPSVDSEAARALLSRDRPPARGTALAATPTSRRAFAAAHHVSHPAISSLLYANFMQDCRTEKVCFNMEARLGTALHLHDSLAAGALGVLCVASEPRAALVALTRAMDFVVAQVEAHVRPGAATATAGAPADAEETPPTLQAVHGTLRFLSQSLSEQPAVAALAG